MVQIDLQPNGTSKPDHVSPTTIGLHLGGSRRDRTSGLSHAVKFAAVHRDFMNEGPALNASARALGVWLRILVYASDKETDLLVGASDWPARTWLAACGVDMDELYAAADAGLVSWENDGRDLRVLGFDHAGLEAVRGRRDAGRFGAMGGRPRKPSGLPDENPQGSKPETPSSLPSSPSPSVPFQYPEVFELIWAHTGKRGAKLTAHKAWVKGGRPPLDRIAAPWASYLVSDRPRAGFIKDLSTWLNELGWQQEWPEATNATPASTGSATRTAYCGFHESRFNQGKRASRHTETCPECRAWAAANRARESLPESSDAMLKRLGLG